MARCIGCRKSLWNCTCHSSGGKHENTKERVKVKGKDGRTRTVTRNTGNTRDQRGIDWCGRCRSRVMNGRCTNITCSTNK